MPDPAPETSAVSIRQPSVESVEGFLTSYETRNPYFGVFASLGEEAAKQVKTTSEGTDTTTGSVVSIEGVGANTFSFGDTVVQDAISALADTLGVTGGFADVTKVINEAISSIKLTKEVGASKGSLTISYNVSSVVQSAGADVDQIMALPYPFLRASTKQKDYFVVVNGYYNIDPDQLYLRPITYTRTMVDYEIPYSEKGETKTLKVKGPRIAFEEVEFTDGTSFIVVSDKQVAFVGYLGIPQVSGDNSGNIIMNYDLMSGDGIGLVTKPQGKSGYQIMAELNKMYGLTEFVDKNKPNPVAEDDVPSPDSTIVRTPYPLSGEINMLTLIAAILYNCNVVDFGQWFTKDQPDGSRGPASIPFDPQLLNTYSYGFYGGYGYVPQRTPDGASDRAVAGPLGRVDVDIQINNLYNAVRQKIPESSYKNIYGGFMSGSMSIMEYINSMLEPYGWSMYMRNDAQTEDSQRYAIGYRVSGANSTTSSLNDGPSYENSSAVLDGRFGFKLINQAKKAQSKEYIPLFEYGIEVLDFDYKVPAVSTAQDTQLGINMNIGGELFTFQVDKEAIEAYYKEKGSSQVWGELITMLQRDPNEFIIAFTRVAGKVLEGNAPTPTVRGSAGIELSLTLKHAIPGLSPNFLFAFRAPWAGVVPKYVEGVYRCTKVEDDYQAGGSQAGIWTQRIVGVKT